MLGDLSKGKREIYSHGHCYPGGTRRLRIASVLAVGRIFPYHAEGGNGALEIYFSTMPEEWDSDIPSRLGSFQLPQIGGTSLVNGFLLRPS